MWQHPAACFCLALTHRLCCFHSVSLPVWDSGKFGQSVFSHTLTAKVYFVGLRNIFFKMYLLYCMLFPWWFMYDEANMHQLLQMMHMPCQLWPATVSLSPSVLTIKHLLVTYIHNFIYLEARHISTMWFIWSSSEMWNDFYVRVWQQEI